MKRNVIGIAVMLIIVIGSSIFFLVVDRKSKETQPVMAHSEAEPTIEPTIAPTPEPTIMPTPAPTPDPTPEPTVSPTPDQTPETVETPAPTKAPEKPAATPAPQQQTNTNQSAADTAAQMGFGSFDDMNSGQEGSVDTSDGHGNVFQ